MEVLLGSEFEVVIGDALGSMRAHVCVRMKSPASFCLLRLFLSLMKYVLRTESSNGAASFVFVSAAFVSATFVSVTTSAITSNGVAGSFASFASTDANPGPSASPVRSCCHVDLTNGQ